MNTVYIAGKISGDADYKQKFNEAQKNLEERGFAVMNPAWLPSEGFSYEAYIRIGKAMLKECSVLCLLPDWEESAGACNELQLAASLKKEIIYYSDIIAEPNNDNNIKTDNNAEVDNNTQNVYYYKLAMRGNADHFRRLFGSIYECQSTANLTKPSQCDYIIKTEIKPKDMDKCKAVSILALAANADLVSNNLGSVVSYIDLCAGYFETNEGYAEDSIDIEKAFAHYIASPFGAFYSFKSQI